MRVFALLMGVLCVAACSTITRGTTQAVAINTPGVEKAECELRSEGIGTLTIVTPASVVLEKSMHSVQVSCRKKCFTNGEGVIASSTEEMTAGNILVGGVVGLAVDASSGAMNKYEPQIAIAMNPIKGCRA
ncbi:MULTISPECIES: hypothetical protein [Rhodomicrobium]|uniref:hypothetical protein n=1 Tax=Rhodomicrobium TaxID=1068 RepID=UPI000F738CB1|nr:MULTISPECIES: hypothetical protein [Rhodomicrobium]